MPVSISLGIWTTLLVYLISIPLGIGKAVRDGSRFDVWTIGLVIVGNAVPSFLFAILLIVLFAGGSYFDWFPLRGLTSTTGTNSPGRRRSPTISGIWPCRLAMVIGGFRRPDDADQEFLPGADHQQYVVTARAKGLTETRVLYGHVFRNAMLIVIAGFPSAFHRHPVYRRPADRE